jgi:hypothetical protein
LRPRSKSEASPKADLDRLYSGSLTEFTSERNALAKQLRSDGESKAAAQVARLRKPTAAAGAVNRLFHHHRGELDKLLEAADKLRSAQDAALQGEGGQRLRRAMKSEREAIDRLLDLVRSDGASGVTLDRVQGTLEAAVSDPAAQKAVETGRLERELRPGQISTGSSSDTRSNRAGGSQRKAEIATARRELDELGEKTNEAERAEQQFEDAKKRAEAELKTVRSELSSAKKEARSLSRQKAAAERKLSRLKKR